MHSSTASRIWILRVVAAVATTLGVLANGPPSSLVEKLGAEKYPVRVGAEKELFEWAEANGKQARAWLLRESKESVEPEVRRRAMAVLKAVVVRDLTRQRPGYVGVKMSNVEVMVGDKQTIGVGILGVVPGTPADRAGLQVNDVVLKLNGKGWTKPAAYHEFGGRISGFRGGDKVRLEVLRDGEKREVELELAPRPWALRLYPENPGRRAAPFGRGLQTSLNEEQAIEEAFRGWLEKQEGGVRSK